MSSHLLLVEIQMDAVRTWYLPPPLHPHTLHPLHHSPHLLHGAARHQVVSPLLDTKMKCSPTLMRMPILSRIRISSIFWEKQPQSSISEQLLVDFLMENLKEADRLIVQRR